MFFVNSSNCSLVKQAVTVITLAGLTFLKRANFNDLGIFYTVLQSQKAVTAHFACYLPFACLLRDSTIKMYIFYNLDIFQRHGRM